MSESMPSLTINDQGERVAELQKRLGALGYKIPVHEIEGKLFGVGTRDALLRFQRKQKLRLTGRLDARSGDALARTAAVAETGRHRIEGRVFLDNGAPAADVALRVVGQGFAGSEQIRCEAKTDEQGFYVCAFGMSDRPESIQLQCLDAAGKATPISTKTFVEGYTALNLVAPAEVKPRVLEYDRLRGCEIFLSGTRDGHTGDFPRGSGRRSGIFPSRPR
jgi:peptidoglycan hydrolase-like protein with peptidoglycan-binding domain